MKILILTAFHHRPEISRLYWMGIERLREKFNVETLAVCSDKENIKLAGSWSDYTIETENYPLGRKHNAGLIASLKIDYDHLMQLGSDNLICNELMGMYQVLDKEFFGTNNLLVIDAKTKETKQKKYFHIFGAGRMLRKDVILECVYYKRERMYLWDDCLNSGLDYNSEMKFAQMGYLPFEVKTKNPMVIDVKSEVNIWPFDKMDGNSYPFKDLQKTISEAEYKYLMSL